MAKLPRIGFGCFPLSLEAISDKDALAIIATAYKKGYRLFNTANTYGKNGRSETLLGRALSNKRKNIIIISKGGYTESYEHCGSSREIIRACEKSLKRLKTDYIDIYELHAPDPRVPIEESMQAFVKLRKDGKIRFVGLSQASLEEIKRAEQIIELLVVELEYSIRVRNVEEKILPWCKENRKYLIAFMPLGRGYLTEKLGPETENLIPYTKLYRGIELRKTIKGARHLKLIAQKLKCTVAQLSLAYLLNISDWVIPVPGATKAWQIKENYEALNIKLKNSHLEKIMKVFR